MTRHDPIEIEIEAKATRVAFGVWDAAVEIATLLLIGAILWVVWVVTP